MERMNKNLNAAQKLLMVAVALEPENPAVLMVSLRYRSVRHHVFFIMNIHRMSIVIDFDCTVQEIALVEKGLGNTEVADEYFQKAGIADKRKSRVKRRMFESRKAAPKFKVPKQRGGSNVQETDSSL